MRPLIVLLIWATFLGAVQGYRSLVRGLPQREEETFTQDVAQGEFFVELSLTFNAVPDDFAGGPAIQVIANGHTLLESPDPMEAGTPIRVSAAGKVVVGENEFLVKASAVPEAELAARGIMVRVLRDNQTLVEHILWAEAGELIGGSFVIDVPADTNEKPRGHAHDSQSGDE